MDPSKWLKKITELLSIGGKALEKLQNFFGDTFKAFPTPDFTEPDYPSNAVVLEVISLCQLSTYTCGITSTWSIINAIGCKVSLSKWFDKCIKAGCHPDKGMDIDQIRRALKSQRLKVETKRYSSSSQVRKLIDAGQPILFGQGCEMFEDGDHWMFVYGYSPRHVYVGNVVNPWASKESWTWKKFERELVPRELYLINA